MSVLATLDSWAELVSARADTLLFGAPVAAEWTVLPLGSFADRESLRRSLGLALRPECTARGALVSAGASRSLGGCPREWYWLRDPAPPAAIVLCSLPPAGRAVGLIEALSAFAELPLPTAIHVVVFAAVDPGIRRPGGEPLCHEALADLDDWRRSTEGGNCGRRGPRAYTVVTGITDLGIWDSWDVGRATAFFVATLASHRAFSEKLLQCTAYSSEPLYGTFGIALPSPSGQVPPTPETLAAILTIPDGLERVETTNGDGAPTTGAGPRDAARYLHAAPDFRLMYVAGFPLGAVAV